MYSTKSICHDKTFWAICYNQHLHLLHWMYVHTIITDACHKDDMQPLFFMLKSFCFISGVQCGLSHSWNQALTTHTCQSNCLQCSHSFIQNLPHLWNRCKLGLKSSPFSNSASQPLNFPFIKSSSLFLRFPLLTNLHFYFVINLTLQILNFVSTLISLQTSPISFSLLLFLSDFLSYLLPHVIQPQSISNWHFSISFLHIISSFCFFYYISCDLDLVLPHTPPPSWFHFSGTFHDFQWDSLVFQSPLSAFHDIISIQSCNSFHACGISLNVKIPVLDSSAPQCQYFSITVSTIQYNYIKWLPCILCALNIQL